MRDLSDSGFYENELICKSPGDQPIAGSVEFIFVEPNKSIMERIPPSGRVVVPTNDGKKPKLAVVKPTDGHWPVVVSLSDEKECTCPQMIIPQDLLWWRQLPYGRQVLHNSAEGIHIGVVDIPATSWSSLSHIQMYDIEGSPLSDEGMPKTSHGLRVSAIIAERGTTDETRGIAPGAKLTLIDVTDDDLKDEWDYSKIGPAIKLLVDQFNVDVINISGGCHIAPEDERFADACAFFDEFMEYAAEHGVLVIASTGNDPKAEVALPARLPGAIGVGAVGLAGVAPPTSRTHLYEKFALDTPGLSGRLDDKVFFHFCDTSFGHGLDMVGPGIGVVMTFENGIFVEYDGTSYAAPYVTAVAACAFSMSKSANVQNSRKRGEIRRRHLEALCASLGMDDARQGAGIPVLENRVASRTC